MVDGVWWKRTLLLMPVTLCAFNLAFLSLFASYDLHLGPIHLVAHGFFKSILFLEVAFLITVLAAGWWMSNTPRQLDAKEGLRFSWLWFGLLTALTVGLYLPSFFINFIHHDWNHNHISASLHSLRDATRLFTVPQPDGFYRPLTFLSLWLDYSIFGSQWWGYHLQSVGLHLINALLIYLLARQLGLPETQARWAAILFAGAAVAFEAVLWPAARFDLLATFFTLLALIAALAYLGGQKDSWLGPTKAAIFLLLGILNKESAYCFPLLLTCSILFRREKLGRSKRRILRLATTCGLVIAGMVLVRLVVFHGLGGYGMQNDSSEHFHLGWRSLTTLLFRVPVSIFGVNTSMPPPIWVKAAIVALALTLTAMAMAGARANRRQALLLAGAFLSAMPTINIIGWIGGPMQHSRYLYMPAAWMALFIAAISGGLRLRNLLLALFLAANVLGASGSLHVYKVMLENSGIIADKIRRDYVQNPNQGRIFLVDFQGDPYGVFFLNYELTDKIKTLIPEAVVENVKRTQYDPCSGRSYRWDSVRADLVEIPLPSGCGK